MKNFLKLIETARTHGIILEYDKSTGKEGKLKESDLVAFWKCIESCQPFVFYSDSQEITFDREEIHTTLENAPFPIFSIENINEPIFKQTSTTSSSAIDDGGLFFDCILCIETAPLCWNYFALIHGDTKLVYRVVKFIQLQHILVDYLSCLSKQEIGIQPIRERIKIGSNKEKRTHTIRQIVHVCPKKQIEKLTETFGIKKTIDWTHRWKVRGHWVRIREGKIGKNRDGIYCLTGFTWRKDHEKGPKDAPMVTKTRVVVESDNR
jgi:hypothetical protein